MVSLSSRWLLAGPSILLASAVLSCHEGRLPVDPPTLEIQDGAHNAGNGHFYFLPPVVKKATFTGTFDGSLAPIVEICDWTGSACAETIAQFTTTSGTGGELVRVSAADQAYQVLWHTNDFNLDPARTYRIRVLAGTTELGHADVDVVNNGSELKNVATGEFVPLLDGRTLPIKFRIENGAMPSRFNITLATDGTGSGTVTISPAGDSCGPDCHQYDGGTAVEIAASANTGSTFTTLAGLGCGTANPCSATVTENTTVTGTFTLNTVNVTLATGGTGSGTVAILPTGASCGVTCYQYDYGTPVTISATANTGSSFTSFAGLGCATTNPCSTAATTTATVTGNFTLNNALTLTPTSQDFGTLDVGQASAPFTFTVTNTGAALAALSLQLIGGSDYSVTTPSTCLPALLLPAGGTCTFVLVFRPGAAGVRPGTLVIGNSGISTVSATLTGTGATTTISLTPTSHDFGTLPVGQASAPFTFTVTNTGAALAALSLQLIGGSDYSVTTPSTCLPALLLPAGGTCTFVLVFRPGAAGVRPGTLVIGNNGISTVPVPLTGMGATTTITITPTSQDFGTLDVGQASAPFTFTVTNTGAALAALSLQLIGGSDYSVTTPSTCLPALLLPAGGTCTFVLVFRPGAAGVRPGTLVIGNNGISTVSATLTGTGATTTISLTPTSHDFGTLPVGQASAPFTFTVTNTGAALAALSLQLIGGSDYSVTTPSTCLPALLLPAGGTCTFVLVFRPGAAGVRPGTLVIGNNGISTVPATLTGTGL